VETPSSDLAGQIPERNAEPKVALGRFLRGGLDLMLSVGDFLHRFRSSLKSP